MTAVGAVAEPELTMLKAKQPARPGKPFTVTYEVSWVGDAVAYTVLPAQIEDIDWGTAALTTTRTFLRDGENVVVQTVEIVPHKPGQYQAPVVHIPYVSPQDTTTRDDLERSEGLAAQPDAPSLTAESFTIEVKARSLVIWAASALGGAVAVLIGVAAAVWLVRHYRHQRRPGEPEPETKPDLPAAQRGLHTANQFRLDGDYYRFYGALARSVGALFPNEDTKLETKLTARARDVGYRGVRPTEDEMDTDFREVERMLRRTTEDT